MEAGTNFLGLTRSNTLQNAWFVPERYAMPNGTLFVNAPAQRFIRSN